MKKIVLIFIAILLQTSSQAQVMPGYFIQDSTLISFTDSNTFPSYMIGDTATQPLWQIGNTHKPFFLTGANSIKGIMTDTLNSYPINANNWFTLIINPLAADQIVSFWHRYQTDQGHDGGIVEFSLDSGMTWQNIMGDCNTDGQAQGQAPGIHTDNFYSATDTLLTGEPAFSGTSNGTICSRLQFYMALFPKLTQGGGICVFTTPVYLRFRFVSDSKLDTLAGWIIDSISVRADYYEDAGVASVHKTSALHIYPNPSNDGIYNLPALLDEQNFNIEVYDAIGDRILKIPYTHLIDLSKYPCGAYYYKVTNGTAYYNGKLIKD